LNTHSRPDAIAITLAAILFAIGSAITAIVMAIPVYAVIAAIHPTVTIVPNTQGEFECFGVVAALGFIPNFWSKVKENMIDRYPG
jgi:hypothetical protein